MNLNRLSLSLLALLQALASPAFAGQAPGAASAPDIAISSKDRVYLSDQSSNTVSVVDPATEKLLGVIRLGDQTPGQPQSAVQGATTGPRHGFFTGPQDTRCGLDRL